MNRRYRAHRESHAWRTSDVRFDVFRSDDEGAARIYGPVTRKTDGSGQRNAPGNLDNLKAGNYEVVRRAG